MKSRSVFVGFVMTLVKVVIAAIGISAGANGDGAGTRGTAVLPEFKSQAAFGAPMGGPVTESPEDVRAYWTPDRIRAAVGAMETVAGSTTGSQQPRTNDGPSMQFPSTAVPTGGGR